MKIKVAEAKGKVLDYLVVVALGFQVQISPHGGVEAADSDYFGSWGWCYFSPSIGWAHGGPIIERVHIDLTSPRPAWPHCKASIPTWVKGGYQPTFEQYGPTPLIAAMRCFAASRLGDEVDVPEELMA